ncbi:hypothetical protein U1Q18_028052, partial [Sarracenia purpurea var. burkii]
FPFQSSSSSGPPSTNSPSNTWLSPLLLFDNCPSVLPPFLGTHSSNALPHTYLPNTQPHQYVRPPAPANDAVTLPNAPSSTSFPAANNIAHDVNSVLHLSDAHDTNAAAPLSATLLNTANDDGPLSDAYAVPTSSLPYEHPPPSGNM